MSPSQCPITSRSLTSTGRSCRDRMFAMRLGPTEMRRWELRRPLGPQADGGLPGRPALAYTNRGVQMVPWETRIVGRRGRWTGSEGADHSGILLGLQRPHGSWPPRTPKVERPVRRESVRLRPILDAPSGSLVASDMGHQASGFRVGWPCRGPPRTGRVEGCVHVSPGGTGRTIGAGKRQTIGFCLDGTYWVQYGLPSGDIVFGCVVQRDDGPRAVSQLVVNVRISTKRPPITASRGRPRVAKVWLPPTRGLPNRRSG